MPKIPSIAIVDVCSDGLNIWHVTTRDISFNESRLVGAWNFETYVPDDIEDLIDGRYSYVTKEAEKVLRKLNIRTVNNIDLKMTLKLANERVKELKKILDDEQATRKSYLQLAEPEWPQFDKNIDLQKLVEKDKSLTTRPLLIARWFESQFKLWDKFEEIRLGSLFLRQKTSSEYKSLELIVND